MKSTNWKDIAELFGIMAIVASLIFVGLQMKQSHEIALSEAWQQRPAMSSAAFFSLSENDAALAALVAVQTPDDAVEPNGTQQRDILAFQYWMLGMLQVIENMHYQYMTSYMSADGWLKARNALKEQLRINPLARLAVQKAKGNMSSAFRREIENIEADAESESDT